MNYSKTNLLKTYSLIYKTTEFNCCQVEFVYVYVAPWIDMGRGESLNPLRIAKSCHGERE